MTVPASSPDFGPRTDFCAFARGFADLDIHRQVGGASPGIVARGVARFPGTDPAEQSPAHNNACCDRQLVTVGQAYPNWTGGPSGESGAGPFRQGARLLLFVRLREVPEINVGGRNNLRGFLRRNCGGKTLPSEFPAGYAPVPLPEPTSIREAR